MGELYEKIRNFDNGKYKKDIQVMFDVKNGKKELGLGYYVSLIDNFCEMGKIPYRFVNGTFNWLDSRCPNESMRSEIMHAIQKNIRDYT